ncbi:MAG: hypothetical protein FWH03_01025 [Firmicutes bacterium]|nr:hypothetical protein [Bacillota bacterium]
MQDISFEKLPRTNFAAQFYTAEKLGEFLYFLDTSAFVAISGVDSPKKAKQVKEFLLRFYAASETAYILCGGKSLQSTVSNIDAQSFGAEECTVLMLPQSEFDKARYGYPDLIRITQRLTAPDGCAWDKAQTHGSIAKNALEEAAELTQAIANNDIQNMQEECGDVLLQAVFHGDIARRNGTFTIEDIIDTLCKKLITRHTHVFGSDKAATEEEALAFWNNAKKNKS